MDIDRMLCSMIDLFKNSGQLRDKTFAVELVFEAKEILRKMDARHPQSDKTYHKQFVILAHSPSNYTKICFNEVIDHETDLFTLTYSKKNIELKFEADHDSCWRDGVSRILRKFAEIIDSNISDKAIEVQCHTGFGLTEMKLLNGKINSRNGYETGKAIYIPNIENE